MKRFILSSIIISYFICLSGVSFAEETLTWSGCLAEAKKNNPDLISKVETVNQQKAARAVSASGLYPQVDASLNASTLTATSRNASTGVKTSATTDDYSYGVSGSQLLFDGLKTVNNVKSASENIKAAQEGYRFTSSEVRYNLRTAFVNLLKSQQMIQVAEEIAKIRRDNLILISLRYQSGLEHRGALLTAEADVAQAKFGVSQAKRDVVVAQRQLTKEMGRLAFTPMVVNGELSVSDAALGKPDFEALIKNNPALLQAAAKKNAASFSVRSAYAEFFPQLTGQLGADRLSSRWPPRNNSWSAGLGVSMPLFEGGLRFAQVAQAKAALRQAEADERSIRDNALVSLEETWASLQDAIETVAVQRKSLEATVERAKIAEAQYSTGFITFDSWTIIQDNLVSAKQAYLNAQANALFSEASWIQAKGETLEYAQ
ncbi:MAG TPA: TolC family protein [Candidatus Omnitrophota bacterium]|nr:TolC family protein [Candidatus Omnitrophota bacterium]